MGADESSSGTLGLFFSFFFLKGRDIQTAGWSSLVYRRLELNIGKTVQLEGDCRRQQQPHDPLDHQQDCSGEVEQFQTPASGGRRPGPRGPLDPSHPSRVLVLAAEIREVV